MVGQRKAPLRPEANARLDVKMSFSMGHSPPRNSRRSGREFRHDVPVTLDCRQVFYRDGSKQTVFQRFISHPFWQYSHQTALPPVERK